MAILLFHLVRRSPRALVGAIIAPAFAFAANAQTPVAGPPAFLEAVARSPLLDAASRRIDAARARTESAGRLADPDIEAMASRAEAGAMGDDRNMWELNVRQPLPKRGERAADRDRARAVTALAEADYALAAGDLAADVAVSLAEAGGAQARARLIEAQLTRLDSVLKSIETRLATGAGARIADRLTVQTRVASLQLTLEQAQRDAGDARSAARGLLGLSPDAPLPEFAAPTTAEIDPADAAALSLAFARAAEAEAMSRMARASANPMTAVGLRFERERSSMGSQDIVGLAFMSEIPFRGRRYARAEIRAAQAERAAAEADAVAVRHRIVNTLTRVGRAERLAATARRLAEGTEQRLAAEHEALSRAASVTAGAGGMAGETAVLHAVDILDKSTETQLQIIEADTAARTARAELWRFVPTFRLLNVQP